MAKKWTILELLKETESYFKKKGIATARLDAEVLLGHCLQRDRVQLYLDYDSPVNREELSCFRELVKKRAERVPVAYLTGYKEFWSLKIKVTKDVLIPRPETEILLEEAFNIITNYYNNTTHVKILEIGTGSGAIAVALADRIGNISVYATDISMSALEVARANIKHFAKEDKITTVCAECLSAFKKGEMFDMVLSNPPYVRSDKLSTLEPEIRCYEPLQALDGGEDGLDFYIRCIPQIPSLLKKGGWVALEIGDSQAALITEIFQSLSVFTDIKLVKDYSQCERVILAKKQ